MSNDFMKVSSIEEVTMAMNGTIQIYQTLKEGMNNEANTIDGALKLSIKFWSISSTLSECIYQLSEYVRMSTTTGQMRYAKVINQTYKTSSQAEIAAKNDSEYLNNKYNEVQRYQNLLDYLVAIKKDVDMAHYICKEAYTRQSEMYLATYRNK